ncbi:MAG TPA: glycosyltransferase [Xanthomonadales bacterium]|nr:glycosyltransferase [Xanthomonadales bacterium]
MDGTTNTTTMQPSEAPASTALRPPRVSVLMPVYNGERWIREALDSALAQTFRDFEIVVFDDGSTDSSRAIALEYQAANPGRVRVFWQDNQGLARVRNATLRVARGDLLAFLDCDDVWLPHHLATAVACFDREADLAMVHANIVRIGPSGEVLDPARPRWRARHCGDPFASLLLRREHISNVTAVVRRSVLDRVGDFDPRFHGCEDRDLWLRVAHDFPVRYVDEVTAYYRMHGSNTSGNLDRMLGARRQLVDKFATTRRGRALRRRALAAIEMEAGAILRDAGRMRDARYAYLRAALRQPSRMAIWKGLAATLVARRATDKERI